MVITFLSRRRQSLPTAMPLDTQLPFGFYPEPTTPAMTFNGTPYDPCTTDQEAPGSTIWVQADQNPILSSFRLNRTRK
jgi:hypothetical protein